MSKKTKKTEVAEAVAETPAIETPTATETVTPVVVAEEKAKGKPGRPIIEGSARQLRLQARAEKLANGGAVKRGRPAVEGSARQLRLQARAEKLAQGLEIKPGRPKMIKVETKEAAVQTEVTA